MATIKVLFTRRKSIFSWLIRWALPRSRFSLGECSHCLVVDCGYAIEAKMFYGVKKTPIDQVVNNSIVVKEVDYEVEDVNAGISWLRFQVGKSYDWLGVFGLVWNQDRDWQDESNWFCFELAAATLHHAGRKIFNSDALVTGSMLMSIMPGDYSDGSELKTEGKKVP